MKRGRLLFALAVLVGLLPGQAPKFQLALPGRVLHFPADDFAHPGFANEWWYFTGNLQTPSGRRFGFELTFFRISPAPATPLDRASRAGALGSPARLSASGSRGVAARGPALINDLYFTHFAISDIAAAQYTSRERARRGNWHQAGLTRTPTGFRLYNENWSADFDPSGPRHLDAAWGAMSLNLDLTPGPRMLNGVNGWSQKGNAPGQASYYYSFPDITATGQVNGQTVSGHVWMDHEFASDQLSSNQQGWDWMGLRLNDGTALMLFNLRDTDGARDPHSAGTLRTPNGVTTPLRAADFAMTPTRWWHAYPIAWRVRIPSRGLDLTVTAELDDQLFRAPATGVNYWEGAVTVANTAAPHTAVGEGYLELTGYGARFNLLQTGR